MLILCFKYSQNHSHALRSGPSRVVLFPVNAEMKSFRPCVGGDAEDARGLGLIVRSTLWEVAEYS